MAKNIYKIAEKLGAQVKGKVADVGGGAFGMARLAEILSARLQPSLGCRPRSSTQVRKPEDGGQAENLKAEK
jgi:hypothetical protein